MLAAGLLACFAIVAIGSALDRIGESDPSAAGLVPSFFAARSLDNSAAALIARQEYSAALPLAQDAVATLPLNPRSTGLLGAALLGTNQPQAADAAYRVAGQLGWREPLTQSYWIQVAMATGDWAIAAQRLDALFRTRPLLAGRAEVSRPMEMLPEGRAAIARRLADRPGWKAIYFNPSSDIGAEGLQARAQIFAATPVQTGERCDIAGRFARLLVANDQIATAREVWRSQCDLAERSALFDGDFRAAKSGNASPFGWEYLPDGSVNVSKQGGGGVQVGTSASFPRQFARQLLAAAPGKWQLEWQEAGSGSDNRIVPSLDCRNGAPRPGAVSSVGEGAFSASIVIPERCDTPWLNLFVSPGAERVALKRMRLTRTDR